MKKYVIVPEIKLTDQNYTKNREINRKVVKKVLILPVPFVINLFEVNTFRVNPKCASQEKHVVVRAPKDMNESFESTDNEDIETPKSPRVIFFVC